MRLLVRLKPLGRTPSSIDEYARIPEEQVARISEEYSASVMRCCEALHGVLPTELDIQPLKNLNVVVVNGQPSSSIERIKHLILETCDDVLDVTEDERIQLFRSQARQR